MRTQGSQFEAWLSGCSSLRPRQRKSRATEPVSATWSDSEHLSRRPYGTVNAVRWVASGETQQWCERARETLELPRLHPPLAVVLVVLSVELADLREQPLVLDGPRRALTSPALVVGRRRPAERAADKLDAEATAIFVDERAHFARPPSSSVAKNTLAARRISFALRSSALSRVSCLISSRSRSSAARAAARDRPQPGAHAYAASQPAARSPPRRARSAAPTRARDERRGRSAPGGTSWIVASMKGVLSGGQIVLHSRSPSNPGWLSRDVPRSGDRFCPTPAAGGVTGDVELVTALRRRGLAFRCPLWGRSALAATCVLANAGLDQAGATVGGDHVGGARAIRANRDAVLARVEYLRPR